MCKGEGRGRSRREGGVGEVVNLRVVWVMREVSRRAEKRGSERRGEVDRTRIGERPEFTKWRI